MQAFAMKDQENDAVSCHAAEKLENIRASDNPTKTRTLILSETRLPEPELGFHVLHPTPLDFEF